MSNKLIFTKQNDRIISSLFEDNNLVQINVEKENMESLLGNIYIGKVKNIVKNINAAFIEIADQVMCYYSISDNLNPIFVNKKNNTKVNIGDELIVQISKENIKTKAPVLTCNINLTGKYVVLTHGKTMVGISNKITDEKERKRLRKIFNEIQNEDYGYIIRTNASHTKDQYILDEVKVLHEIYNRILEYGKHRTPFSLIYKAPPNYICDIRDASSVMIEEFITDDIKIHDTIKEYLTDFQKEDKGKLRFYEDSLLSLANLYSIDSKLEHALREKIWLKSGGSIIIQPTEAFIVIDVNTGKATAGKKKANDTFLKINLEAAREIAKQLRLRNLSGIIVIDFIDMADEESKINLMEELRELFSRDPIKTIVVDITPLNLVEVTRKKVRKPLYEQCTSICQSCSGSGRV